MNALNKNVNSGNIFVKRYFLVLVVLNKLDYHPVHRRNRHFDDAARMQ